MVLYFMISGSRGGEGGERNVCKVGGCMFYWEMFSCWIFFVIKGF